MATDNAAVDYDAIAADVRIALETVMGKIPQFGFPMPTKDRLRMLKSVPQEFIEDLTETVDSTDVGLNKVFDTAEARNLMKFVAAFRPMIVLANQVGADLDYSVKSAYSHVASSALDAYAITSRVARNNDESMHVKAQSARKALSKRFPARRHLKAADKSTPPTGNTQ